MREKKYVKFRVDMYEDTKAKIIDMKPERDLIHYIWNRVVILAGKVNLEGELYLSKSIPYTIETLAIEFNREPEQIKLALDTFMELEMIELINNKIYKVKNFAKHQNIKVKEQIQNNAKEILKNSNIKELEKSNDIAKINENLEVQSNENRNEINKDVLLSDKNIEEKAKLENKENIGVSFEIPVNNEEIKIQEVLIDNTCTDNKECKSLKSEDSEAKNCKENIEVNEISDLESKKDKKKGLDFKTSDNDLNKPNKNTVKTKDRNNKDIEQLFSLNVKKNKKQTYKQNKNEELNNIKSEEIEEDSSLVTITDGERILEPGEKILQQWAL